MRRKSLGGFTLVEMLVAIAFSATIMSMLGVLVSRVYSRNASSAEHVHDITTLGRLARQFRQDVHASVEATASADDANKRSLTLTAADGTRVEYALADGRLERTRSAANQSQQFDQYPLDSIRVVRWSTSEREVTLVIGRLAPRGSDPPALGRTFEIVALLAEPPAAEAAPATSTPQTPGEP
jgi:type II secretory pathway component PulJ